MKYTSIIFFLFVMMFAAMGFAQETAAIDSNAVEMPPEWLVNLLQMLHDMPVVGPFVASAVQWIGVIVTIITSFTAFLWVSVKALSRVVSVAGLIAFADKLKAFENGRVMYWLKYFSAFNAPKKPEPKA